MGVVILVGAVSLGEIVTLVKAIQSPALMTSVFVA
jgi:hypothetical protein